MTDNYLIDVKLGIIMDVEASRAIRQAEVGAAKTMIERTEERFGVNAECAKREVLAVLLEVAELSHGKNLSFDDQWELWCEAQQKKFERMDARYFLRR